MNHKKLALLCSLAVFAGPVFAGGSVHVLHSSLTIDPFEQTKTVLLIDLEGLNPAGNVACQTGADSNACFVLTTSGTTFTDPLGLNWSLIAGAPAESPMGNIAVQLHAGASIAPWSELDRAVTIEVLNANRGSYTLQGVGLDGSTAEYRQRPHKNTPSVDDVTFYSRHGLARIEVVSVGPEFPNGLSIGHLLIASHKP